ncbi:hypothetical protein [Filimonas effusa]|uniref:Uncharacterized protein n=1 Tax=Filimonas effusa TaxID=2508721 RepID=A0A4Q1CZV6_9BACT|nr:hypothetical protein [Filimonas effusa]RXK80947.1 hypothetical protein ESB13_22595 [Filimonas effusa]
MKKRVCLTVIIAVITFIQELQAQCSICTKTAMQLGEGPAKGLNGGILYLMATPLLIMFIIGYRWWKRERQVS